MFGRFRPKPADDGLAVAILKLLEEQMGTALEVTQRLEQRFEGRLDIGAGEVYPLLQYLEDRGFIAPNQKAKVKITAYDYSIYGGLDATLEQISADAIEIAPASAAQCRPTRVLPRRCGMSGTTLR